MSFVFKEFTDDDINDALSKALDALNSLSEGQRIGAKLAASDQKDGDARVVIFYPADPLPPCPNVPGGSWVCNTEKTRDDYETELYQPTQGFLDGLSDAAAFYAQITFTNFRGGTATLTTWTVTD